MPFFKRNTPSLIPSLTLAFALMSLLLVLIGCQSQQLELDPVPTFESPLETNSTTPDDSAPATESESADSALDNAEEEQLENDAVTAEEQAEGDAAQENGSEIIRATGRIAFVNLRGELATINPDGSEERVLSEDGRFYQFPAWSPTSREIAVIGFSEEGSGVFVYDDQTEGEIVGTAIYEDRQNAPIYLYWFPDGSQVSFIAPSQTEQGLALHLVPADGSSDGDILTTGQPLYWQWLRNNRQAMVHVGTDRLGFVDVDGNENSTGLGNNGVFQAPAISTNNRYFAYQQVTSEGRKLQIKDISADEIIHETPHDGVLAMAWSPAALQIAYVNPQETAQFIGPLDLFDVDSGAARTLVPQNVLTFFWSPDGRYIAFLTPDDLNRQTGVPTDLIRTSNPTQERPTLALGVVEVATGRVDLVADFVPNNLFIRQFIPFFDQYALSHRIWSPDSRFIVLPVISEENDQPVIRIFGIDGRTPQTITTGVSAFWSHQE